VTIPGRLALLSRSLRTVLQHSRVAIAAGGYPLAEARHALGRDPAGAAVVAPGVDVKRFVPLATSERERLRRDDQVNERFVVASYSRLVPRKGMDTLIRAAAQLAPRYPQLLVEIGGSGRDRARLERLATRTGAPVRFLGRVADDRLVGWLGRSDLFVMDCRSRWWGLEQEGFGIVFVEAAACALAVIAGRSGGSHEAVLDGRTGIVLDNPRSVDDLAAAMAALIEDDERRLAYGAAAREWAVSEYSWSALVARLEAALAPTTTGDCPAGSESARSLRTFSKELYGTAHDGVDFG
jgi:phosphatidylinositol alpha-1,6-mannosyltransferase